MGGGTRGKGGGCKGSFCQRDVCKSGQVDFEHIFSTNVARICSCKSVQVYFQHIFSARWPGVFSTCIIVLTTNVTKNISFKIVQVYFLQKWPRIFPTKVSPKIIAPYLQGPKSWNFWCECAVGKLICIPAHLLSSSALTLSC